LIKIIKDIENYFKFKRLEKNKKYCFFVENQFIYQYLKPYIKNKKKSKIVIVSFDELNINNDVSLIILKTFFFRSLFFLTLKLKFLITSTPDLNNSIFKKTKLSKTRYIYIQHSPVSLTKIYNKKAFLEFDVVQAVNAFQHDEIKKINLLYNKKIKIFKSEYLFLNNKNDLEFKKINKKVLIAPTWHTNFYKLNLHIKIVDMFRKNNIDYCLRPHPMSFKKNEISVENLTKLKIICDLDDELNFTKYNNLISDWSGIFIEFALINRKFPILINTKQKIRNTDSIKFEKETIETYARNKISYCIEINEINKILGLIKEDKNQITKIDEFKKRIFY
tara:strand:+ start:330 stop:1331 length:1002 start_codon:yes stop_codon:yes gene_type:complete